MNLPGFAGYEFIIFGRVAKHRLIHFEMAFKVVIRELKAKGRVINYRFCFECYAVLHSIIVNPEIKYNISIRRTNAYFFLGSGSK
jgi:hypothetical protein